MSEIKPNDRTEGNREKKDAAAAKACSDNLKSNKPRPAIPDSAVTIAVSSCALFDMEAERDAHQVENESEPLKPGAAFPFVKALMTVNARLRELYPESEELFHIIVMTNDHAEGQLINSINHYGLTIGEVCMTGGQSPIGYLRTYKAKLYLSKDSEKVTEAIREGFAAATIFMPDTECEVSDTQLRVAFDGDGVLFSDESEKVMKLQGLDAFLRNEMQLKDVPMTEGPLKCFLEVLVKLQRKFYDKNERMNCPIRTFLVTARDGGISGARALMTLHSWGLESNEVYLLAGAPKGPLLQKIKPHIFFDDDNDHIEDAKKLGTISAHVPYGILQL